MGFTLLELLMVVALISVISLFIVPEQRNDRQRKEAQQIQQQLWQLLKFSREQSIQTQRTITVCPLNTNTQCHSQWSDTLTIFVDINSNATLDTNEIVLTTYRAQQRNAVIRWRNNGRFIRFLRNGFVSSFGSLVFCPTDHTNHNAFSLIISRSGRIRAEQNQSQNQNRCS